MIVRKLTLCWDLCLLLLVCAHANASTSLSSSSNLRVSKEASASVAAASHKRKAKDLSTQFPSIDETLEMARLSQLVYSFRDQNETYCDSYSDNNNNNIRCHWYFHNTELGTQILLVSNKMKKYFAIVFAGTDDVRTSLEDLNIAKKPFGNNSTVKLDSPANSNVKIHAGFNDAVFTKGIFDEAYRRLVPLRRRYPSYKKIYTTGHSLGAANAILTATGLSLLGQEVVSINFGAPRTGNDAWRDFLNTTSVLNPHLGIWRVVLGWDIVPRLPDLFTHVGHTIQLWSANHSKYDKTSPDIVECYYRHYGDDQLGYVGVPLGWYSKPYAWIPGAMLIHHIAHYVEYLEMLQSKKLWTNSFKVVQPIGYDDDVYDEPPDDWYAVEEEWAYER